MQEQEASQEEISSLEEAANYQWEGEEMEVSVGGGVRLVVACLLAVGSVAYWGQRVGVQTEVLAEVLSSFRTEGAEASGVAVGLVALETGQARAQGQGRENAQPAAPF